MNLDGDSSMEVADPVDDTRAGRAAADPYAKPSNPIGEAIHHVLADLGCQG